MPPLALCAVLLAALMHASWNLAAKHAAGCRHFVWIYSVGAVLLWSPAVVWLLLSDRPAFDTAQCVALIATAVLHLGYSLSLQSGYRHADLTVVYPVARGTGPVLSFLGAAVLLHERPGITSVMGLLLVIVGITLVAGLWRKVRQTSSSGISHGLSWGLLTGSFIAAYTLNDGWAVKVLLLHPLLVDAVGNGFRVVVLTPGVLKDGPRVVEEIKRYYRPALMVSVLGTLGYVLVLFAIKLAPISHVAPARELATLVGTYFGARMLKETLTLERIIGALCIVGGVVALALSN